MHLVGEILRNGTTVHIPYLTIHPSYNQRIVIVNRGTEAADYMITCSRSEEDVTAVGGGGHDGYGGRG